MLTNLIPTKTFPSFRLGKLVLIEDCYEFLKPYFKSKRQPDALPIEKAVPHATTSKLERQIEENQILYSKLMTERLSKSKAF